ncbi:unnamed protein product [Prorocentrum cordatum]|uniref:Uncharacterized protein n=1 Tax=Prorocentrum cordatum TaxID=2364126 RepID=A0ABN9TDS4_9DINO|nr:unnamed protein product [Polarella glacialis]
MARKRQPCATSGLQEAGSGRRGSEASTSDDLGTQAARAPPARSESRPHLGEDCHLLGRKNYADRLQTYPKTANKIRTTSALASPEREQATLGGGLPPTAAARRKPHPRRPSAGHGSQFTRASWSGCGKTCCARPIGRPRASCPTRGGGNPLKHGIQHWQACRRRGWRRQRRRRRGANMLRRLCTRRAWVPNGTGSRENTADVPVAQCTPRFSGHLPPQPRPARYVTTSGDGPGRDDRPPPCD